MSLNKVLYNIDQRNDTTAAEKETARANIGAQGALTAGANIQLNGDTISATDTKYTAGSNIQISSGNVISATDTTYTAGPNIDIINDIVSTEKSRVEAGANVSVASVLDNVNRVVTYTVSAANTTYSAGSGISISNDTITNTAPNVKSDWNAAAGSDSEILNKPTIPTVNDGTLTIQRNGTAVATFSANQSSAATANITVPTDTSDLTNGAGFITVSQVPSQVNADWTASSGVSQILHKPTLATKAYGGSNVELTSLVINADDPDGYTDIMADNGSWGKLVTGPYSTLLNSGVNGVGDTNAPIYINSSGQFATCGNLPTVEYIQFNYSNETTAQDSVYTAVANAYTAGKLPVLYCGVANATLYWFPTANGSNGYSFSRTVSNYSYVVTIDATSHVISHQSKEIINYTAGTNVSISANNEISATDTTYTAGSGIAISNSNVISNTMHQDTYGLMISYNTLGNSGTTTHSIGPWRIQVTKAAMAAWDSTTNNYSLHISFAHQDYLDGSIVNGRILVDTLTPWADGAFSTVYTGHNQWGFIGTYTQGGSNDGFGLQLISPDSDPDGFARACPKTMRGYHFTVNCGINAPDWLECDASLLYINNNTSLTSNAARLLLRFKYFYV